MKKAKKSSGENSAIEGSKKISEMYNRKLSDELRTFMEDVRRQNRRVLEKRLFELAAAHYIGKEVSSIFDLERCLRTLADRIADLMSVEIISIMLVSKHESRLAIKVAKGLDKEIITMAKVEVGKGIAGWIAETGQPLLIKDITKDSRFTKRDGKYYTDSLLSVPLKVQDKVIGVINVNNKTSRDIFREEDLDILKTVADLAAVAIENVRLREEAKALDRVRVDFMANVSHELHTPLAAIKRAVELILDEIAGETTDNQKKLLISAKQNIERLNRLIGDLLRLATVESEMKVMKRRLFDVVEIIGDVVAALEPLAEEKKVLFKALLPDKKIEIWGDPDKMCQVMTNLIDNAIKYNKPKGKVEISLEDIGKSVKIHVYDTGIGILEQDLDKIFNRFRRVELQDKDSIKGAGLGLSITKEIIQMHGGEISLESQVGKGTKFIITLPKDLRGQERNE